MAKRRLIQPVVAYVWDIEGLENPVVIDREQFWPGCGIKEIDGHNFATIDWDSCPSWRVDGDFWKPNDPDRELLKCGHELPMRKGRRGWYVRPGRLCKLCAMGIEPST